MTRIDRRAFMAASAASAAVIGAGSVARAQEGGWTTRASLPWIAQEIYAAVLDGRIVTAGGLVQRRDGLHVEDRVAAYDPATDAWSELPRLPEARHHPMVVVAGGQLNIIGGYARTGAGDWVNRTTAWRLEEGGWVWSPKRSTGHIDALEAGTLAAWAVVRAPVPIEIGRVYFR